MELSLTFCFKWSRALSCLHPCRRGLPAEQLAKADGSVIAPWTMTTGYANGVLGSHRYVRWNREDSAEDYTKSEVYAEDEQGRQRRLTPLEKLTLDMSQDEKVVKELTLGKRIGFYRIRGEIGSGNFSQVKLGIHALTKGRLCGVWNKRLCGVVYTRCFQMGASDTCKVFWGEGVPTASTCHWHPNARLYISPSLPISPRFILSRGKSSK